MASPFPATVPQFTLPLPLPIRRRLPPYEVVELDFEFTKYDERGYSADGYTMWAAAYTVSTLFGTINVGVVVNEYSLLVEEALAKIVKELSRYYCRMWAYQEQIPALPVPDGPGLGSPWSSKTFDDRDGLSSFRGFCSGLRSVDPAEIVNLTVGFAPVWAVEP